MPTPYPSLRSAGLIFLTIAVAMTLAMTALLSVDDPVHLKYLIEDSGPVQLTGQTAVACAFALALWYSMADTIRRKSYLMLSYLLMFYTLREADYHYKVSEYAKATQFKRFFSHEMIPLSTKVFLGVIVLLFLVVLYRYLKQEKATFLAALRFRLPWALAAFGWAGVFVISQLIDQIPIFHTTIGQVFEEVFEASAEILALLAMIFFRVQLRAPGAVRLQPDQP